jgi:hypothetical protein
MAAMAAVIAYRGTVDSRGGAAVLAMQADPVQEEATGPALSAQETEFLDKEVQRMLLMKAIRETTDPRVVTSSIYTVPKKDSNKRRPVINLRWVNSHLKTQKFKMTTMKDVKAVITANCWMTRGVKDSGHRSPEIP